jgi:hypothetical protein
MTSVFSREEKEMGESLRMTGSCSSLCVYACVCVVARFAFIILFYSHYSERLLPIPLCNNGW